MKIIPVLLIALFAVTVGKAQKKTVYSNAKGVAIQGYDPVAYFIQHKAMPGTDQFVADWSGSTWKFSSQANLDSFKLAPDYYVPQYGGYCAYGCSEKHKAPADPTAWTIVNNKLYLNYNAGVQKEWLKDTTALIKVADAQWRLLNQ